MQPRDGSGAENCSRTNTTCGYYLMGSLCKEHTFDLKVFDNKNSHMKPKLHRGMCTW